MSERVGIVSEQPAIGQVWRDWDVRYRNQDPGRQLRIDAIEGEHAICTQLTDPWGGQQVGKRRRIKLSRLRPTSTGYKLVRDDPPSSPALSAEERDQEAQRIERVWRQRVEAAERRVSQLEKAAREARGGIADALDAIDNYAADDLGLDHELHALVESWRRALLSDTDEGERP